jgi:putative nucleotidyltransferase with HDIG domain
MSATTAVDRVADVTPDPEIEALLAPLTESRRAHSLEVGRKAESATALVAPHLREAVVAAAYLHDVGYAHRDSGFHPLDGARLLQSRGYSAAVCHLVAHHTASTVEATHRGIPLAEIERFTVNDEDIRAADQVLWWADMTTGPTGETVEVEARLAEIAARYGPDHIVTRSIQDATPLLLAACQAVSGSMYGSS